MSLPETEAGALVLLDAGKHARSLLVARSPRAAGCIADVFGAVVIKKHFTVDKTSSGADHQLSLEATELRGRIAGVRKIGTSLHREENKVGSPDTKILLSFGEGCT